MFFYLKKKPPVGSRLGMIPHQPRLIRKKGTTKATFIETAPKNPKFHPSHSSHSHPGPSQFQFQPTTTKRPQQQTDRLFFVYNKLLIPSSLSTTRIPPQKN